MLPTDGPRCRRFEHYGLKDKVAGKLVFGENVSQAAQFVQSGNAQAGLHCAVSRQVTGDGIGGRFWELPSDAYPELKQAVVIVSASKHKKTAQAFRRLRAVSRGRGHIT